MAHDTLVRSDFEQAMTTLLARLDRLECLADEARHSSPGQDSERPVQAPRS